MRRLATLAVLLLVLPVMAQPPGGRGQGPPPGPREWGPGEMGPRGGGPRFDRLAERLADELGLTEQQETQLDKLVAEYTDQFAREMAPLEAGREPGDREKVRAIRETLHEEFLNDVAAILTPEQATRFEQFRQRWSRVRERGPGDRERGPGWGDWRRQMRELPDQLGLDEQQRAEFDALTEKMREEGRARWEAMRPLIEEMRQARAAGDEQRAAEIRRQMQEQRLAGDRPLESFFAELEKILRPEQKARLAELRQEWQQPGFAPGRPVELRTMWQAVARLNLDEQQRQKIRGIREQAGKTARDLGPRDPAAHGKLAADVKQQILAVLRPEQKAEFERFLMAERPLRERGPGRGQSDDKESAPAKERKPRGRP